MSIFVLLFIFCIQFTTNIEASFVRSNPFWMPLEFDIGKGYFKTNVFIAGLNENTGIVKVCVTSQVTNHTLCHYMNAAEEEGQILAPYVSAHAGIYVFPSFQVPVDTDLNVCVTILKDDKILCKSIRNSGDTTEEMVNLNINLAK